MYKIDINSGVKYKSFCNKFGYHIIYFDFYKSGNIVGNAEVYVVDSDKFYSEQLDVNSIKTIKDWLFNHIENGKETADKVIIINKFCIFDEYIENEMNSSSKLLRTLIRMLQYNVCLGKYIIAGDVDNCFYIRGTLNDKFRYCMDCGYGMYSGNVVCEQNYFRL